MYGNDCSDYWCTAHHDKCLSEMAAYLQEMMNQTISVITNDGRNIIGVLKGFDQCVNVILDDSFERVFSLKEPVEAVELGLYIVRGDNMYDPLY
ncbi:uncharacterized protein PITG_16975 [Phytophthora infestans T30-4]|uniref:U6 snRNA-associated Sm-like protein LSm8 n=1 Tax=Phytophthora infestans (strain T30-4) TaxID=403677 RepID=D0NUI4_PHYIT|nr:uncharacterized protein PITG_16975 [Phytophthora infestans T30-4]EEY65330.1 hypothetical protein PITG_16975 [Phytophthora infestans T30-4]|eukprot:XP_002897193.1 hypothetical protein PITG_16975 [Phytophthora infestans T30-4]